VPALRLVRVRVTSPATLSKAHAQRARSQIQTLARALVRSADARPPAGRTPDYAFAAGT